VAITTDEKALVYLGLDRSKTLPQLCYPKIFLGGIKVMEI